MGVRKFLVIVVYLAMCLPLFLPGGSVAGSIDTKDISKATLDVLQQQFLMDEVLTIIKASPNRASSQAHLRSRPERFRLLAAQQQPPMTVDGYTVLDQSSSIIGYSLFYHGSSGPLVIVDSSVNPLQRAAANAASDLISKALDSVSTPDGSNLYFLGIYDLDASRVIKIMLRKADTAGGPDYAIRYAVSGR
jgi:hypothetical protein